jgi:hypothetical protein
VKPLGNRICKYTIFFANITGKMQIIKDYQLYWHLPVKYANLKGKTLKCHHNANLKGKTLKCHDNANLKGKPLKCHDNANLKGKTLKCLS